MKQKLLTKLLLLLLCTLGGASFNPMRGDDVTFNFKQNSDAYGSGVTPANSTSLSVGTTFTISPISVKYITKGGSTDLRWWNTTDGLRAYKDNVWQIEAASGYEIESIEYAGTITPVETSSTGGTISSKTWTKPKAGGVTSVSFKGSHSSGNKTINSIVVTYSAPVSVTSLSVGTPPTKLNYKKGETLDLTGLVLDADGDDVTSGYTASPANGATLNTVGAQTVTLTYGGQSTTQTIHVGDLESIALTTTSVKTTYDEGQSFDPTNLVVTATYSDGETTATTWTEDVDLEDCTFDPDGTLETTDDNVEVSYTWGSTEKTANIAITVNAASAYTVTFNAGTGSCGTSSLTEASAKAGVTLPTATIDVTGWSFAGWATASTTNTEDEPTLYAAGDTYNPTDNCTLYAVYQFSEKSSTDYVQATSLSEITGASSIVIVNGSYALDNTLGGSVSAPAVTDGVMTPAAKFIFTLSGDNTDGFTLTNGTKRLGAASSSNVSLATDASNYLWTFAKIGETTNFNVLSKSVTGEALERYKPKSGSYNWKTYTSDVTDIYQMKIYVPATITVYNSNPAAMVNPTIAWTTSGDKSLYLQNTNTYDNAANVSGIAKTPVYTSSDETVATVSEAGVVTAQKAGSTTITAKVAKEVGVNTEASVTYDVTVKDASNVAGIKAITSSSSVVTFTADLTDAVVTYVKDNHAFIQDASGAVYASCGSSLTAGKKINGAVSGSVKAANQIDEITAISLASATVTDGVIPSASVISAATLAANKVDYEGKLVSIEDATVTANLTSGSASGGKISDDSKTTEINLYAPDSNIEALKDAEGTFNGYITLYGGNSVRFNIFEQSQITLTKNAPTAQTLSFASDAVELDEDTDDFYDFAGQTVSGAQGSVTYSIDSNDDGVVTSINASTGAVVLSGNRGTATIKAAAAAAEVTDAGVTTPYTESTKTYTITVYPCYTVTFSANGVETSVRQASHGASVAVPSPSDIFGFKFMGWSLSTVSLTDVAPSMESLSSSVTPEDDATYYAVFAVQTVGDDENEEFYKNEGSTGTDATSGITASGNINTNSANGNPGNSFGLTSQANKTATFTGIDIATAKSASLKLDYRLAKSSTYYTSLTVTQYDGEDNVLGSPSEITGSDQNYHTSGNIALNTACVKITIVCTPAVSTYNTFVDNVIITVTRPGVTYDNYCTTVPAHVNIAGTAGYTTYVATDNVSFPGLTAYIATKVNTNTIHLDEVLAVPNGTAVIVKGDKGVYLLDVEDAGDCDDVSANILQASNGNVTGDGSTIFALAKKNEVVGFYLVGDGVPVPAGKAYLNLGGGGSVKGFTFEFEDTEDGINGLTPDPSPVGEGSIYNLAGQKLSKMQKGINIVNGKKIMK